MIAEDNQGGVGLAVDESLPPNTNTPEAPEPTAASSSVSTDGLDSTQSDGQPRDENGRFAPKTEAASSSDVTSAAAPVGSSAPPLDNRSPHESAVAPVADEPKPLTYRAAAREHTYPGAERHADGSVVFKPEAYSNLLNDLAAAQTYKTTWRDTLERTRNESRAAIEETSAKAQSYERIAERLFAVLGDPNELEKLIANHDREYQLLARELSLDLKGTGVPPTRTGQAAMQDAGADPEQLKFAAQQTLVDEVLTTIAHTPTFAALAPDEASRNDLLNYFLETLPAYFEEQNGQIVLDRHKVKRVLEREYQRHDAVAKAKADAAKEAKALKEAMERNAATSTAPNLPAAIPSRGSPAPGNGTRKMTRADWEAYQREHGLG